MPGVSATASFSKRVRSACQISDRLLQPRILTWPSPQPKHICIGFTVKLNWPTVMTKSSGPSGNIFEEFMRRERWRIIFDLRMRSARKRKVEGLDLLEAHNDEHLNGDGLDPSVHQQHMMLSRILFRIREARSPHFKNSLAEPKQAELVSAKGVCE